MSCTLLHANVLFAQCGMTVTATVTNITCYNGTNGSIVVNVTGGTAPYQYQLAEAGAGAWQSSNSFTALTASVYPVSVKDATGCVTTIYKDVTQPAALAATYTAVDGTCTGSNNGSITINTTGGTSPYTYAWTKNGVAFATTANISSLSPANYLLVVTDANGCTVSPIVTSQMRPIALTGFNQDVIANGTGAANASSTQPLDDHNFVYYASGYNNGTTTGTGGLPASGLFTSAQSAGRSYQLNSYTANNSLVLTTAAGSYGSVTSGTLAFTSPYQAPFSTLYVIGTTGNGTGTVNYTVTYSDASTTTGSLSFPDWSLPLATASSIRALGGLDRVSWANPGAFDNSTSFNIWEAPITIPGASQGKNISSVTFAWSAASTARVNIFGITGYTSTTNGIRVNDGASTTVTPAVAVTSTATGNIFCAAQPVTFTANPTNGGLAPTYQWKLNGTNIGGATSPTYTTSSLANGNQITVVLTSNLSCVSTATATSPVQTMTLGTVSAAVATTATGTSICSGTSVTFTATPTNGGASPTYQWKLNGSNIGGATSSTYTSSSLANSDQVTVVATSSIGCATSNPAISTPITMAVTTSGLPTATITSVPAITFTAATTFGGSSPAYQWFKNGVAIGGATSSTYFNPVALLGEVYSVKVTSNYACKTAPAAMSNYVAITGSLLPVTIESFTADLNGKQVILKWRTSMEIQNKQFLVQRALSPGNNFETIGTVAAANIATGSNYIFKDNLTSGGVYLYRLQQEDINGSKKLSNTQSVNLKTTKYWQISNVQAGWKITTAQALQYYLMDTEGRMIEKGTVTGSKIINRPTSGIYFIKLIGDDVNTTEKLF